MGGGGREGKRKRGGMCPWALESSPATSRELNPPSPSENPVSLRSAQIIGTIHAANTKGLATRVAQRSAWQNFRMPPPLFLSSSPPPLPPPHEISLSLFIPKPRQGYSAYPAKHVFLNSERRVHFLAHPCPWSRMK